jgi:NodT family efflux transporter outer membrane factor (OMF) lipoprotein
VNTPRALRRIATATGLALGLSSCATVAPPAPPPLPVPAAWAHAPTPGAAGASALARWWLHLNDPLLARLVEQALLANPSIAGAQAALRQSRAARDVTASGLLPVLDGSASAQRSRTGDQGASNSFRAGLDASWELDVFGGRKSALAASTATVSASAASLGHVQVSTAAEVALVYIELRGTQAQLANAEESLASQLDTLQITEWRLQAGLVSSLPAEQARAAAAQTRAALPLLRTTIAQAQHALAVLVGQPPEALAAELAAAGPVPRAARDLALAIPAETLRQRPDVRAAEYQVAAALASVAEADAARLPSFRLSGSLGASAATLGSLTSGAALAGALLAGVALPLFDGGAGRARVAAQQAALDQSGAQYRATVLAALREVEDALVALQGDRERLVLLQQAAQSAGSAALLARQLYGSGLADFQSVLDTQRTQLTTQDAAARVLADLGADHVRLYKALGGGWNEEPTTR